MTNDTPPSTIPELWYKIDKRLALIEAGQKAYQEAHCKVHDDLDKDLDDHENRLRTGATLHGLLTGSGGLLSIIAIIKAFLIK